jgi:hypothetical protein
MKLNVTFDEQGNILALAPSIPNCGGPPEPIKGQIRAELEVPELSDSIGKFSGLSLLDIHNRLRVDTSSSTPKLVPKSSSR